MDNEIINVVNVDNDSVNNETNKNFEKKNKKKVPNKRKIFSWSLKLNNAFLTLVETHFKWIEQEVALTFIH